MPAQKRGARQTTGTILRTGQGGRSDHLFGYAYPTTNRGHRREEPFLIAKFSFG